MKRVIWANVKAVIFFLMLEYAVTFLALCTSSVFGLTWIWWVWFVLTIGVVKVSYDFWKDWTAVAQVKDQKERDKIAFHCEN